MLVAALRQRILELAIQGKLVPQSPEDGNADELYQQIQLERKKLIAAGKLKKEKPLPAIKQDEITFDIPESWKWARLQSICARFSTGPFGSMLHKKDYVPKGIPVVNPTNIIRGRIDTSKVQRVGEKTCGRLCAFQLNIGDIVLARRGNLSKCAPVGDREKGWLCGTGSFVIHPVKVLPQWLCYYYVSRYSQQYLLADSVGTTMDNLNQGLLSQLPIALPPFSEQQRIVERVQTLFAELDAIEHSQERVAAIQTELNKRILEHAIQGKLVPQRPEEGTAEELYQQIQNEKKKLIAAGKLKKEKPLPPISDDEITFDIPHSWQWVRLGDCTTYGQAKQKATPDQIEDDTWCLELEDIEKDSARILQRLTVGERPIKGDRAVFKRRNVLFSKLRPYLHKILVADADGVCTTELVPFSCYNGILPEYIVLVLMSPCIDQRICGTSYGVKMPRVGTADMLSLPVPLPPTDEQKRIVDMVKICRC